MEGVYASCPSLSAFAALKHLAGCFCTFSVPLIKKTDIYPLHFFPISSEIHMAVGDFKQNKYRVKFRPRLQHQSTKTASATHV